MHEYPRKRLSCLLPGRDTKHSLYQGRRQLANSFEVFDMSVRDKRKVGGKGGEIWSGEPGVSTQLLSQGNGPGLRPQIWFHCSKVQVFQSANVVFHLGGCKM